MNKTEIEAIKVKLNKLEDCLNELQNKYCIDGLDKLDFIEIIDNIKDSLF
tara:strand:+ start:321 stop:470 length:150 start_codon:yes stop_codon:yes gene_type:complete